MCALAEGINCNKGPVKNKPHSLDRRKRTLAGQEGAENVQAAQRVTSQPVELGFSAKAEFRGRDSEICIT